MALKGTITKSISGTLSYEIRWSATQSISDNTSTITCKHYLTGSGYSLNISGRSNTCTVGGVSKSYTSSSVSGAVTEKLLGTTTHTVTHNADGAKTISIKGVFNIQATLSGSYIGSVTASSTATLNTIPRSATINSAQNFDDEGNPVIAYSNPAGNSVSSLDACISLTGAKADIPYRPISKNGTSYTFNLTEEERNTLRNACTTTNSRTVYFYVRTVIGEKTSYSYLDRTFRIVNANPIINPTVVDTNETTIALTGDENKFVKHYSSALCKINAEAKKGASLKNYEIACGNSSINTSSGTFNNVAGNNAATVNFTFEATDSRGNSASQTITKEMVDYIKPTCSLNVSMVLDSSGEESNENNQTKAKLTANVFGDYFNGSFGKELNQLTLVCRYKVGNGNWISINEENVSKFNISTTNTSYDATIVIENLDYRESCIIDAYVKDALVTTSSVAKTVSALPVFDWSEDSFTHNTNLYMGENGDGLGTIFGVLPDNKTYVGNIQPVDENGDCVIGHGNYEHYRPEDYDPEENPNQDRYNTNIYAGGTVDMFVKGASDHVFRARNSENHMIINNAGRLDGNSNTYIDGNEVHIRTNGNLFVNDKKTFCNETVNIAYASPFVKYDNGTAAGTFTAVKRNGIVTICGAASSTEELTSSTTQRIIGTLPSGYRPVGTCIAVMQGTAMNRWSLQVNTGGTVTWSRYGTTSHLTTDAQTSSSVGTWFPFMMTFVAAE